VRLTDPWFAAEFYGEADERGGFTLQGSRIDGAQGLWMWCPCGFHDPKYRTVDGGRPHAIMVPFATPRGAPALPPNHGPVGRDGSTHPRWQMTGTGLEDLTVAPSVAVGKDPECWHGWIQGGEVR
jgi:hypothetical protein